MVRAKKNKPGRGFTLIELLVVISIIGLLASVVLVATTQSRLKAKIVRAQADVKQLAVATTIMAQETDRWPNGCSLSWTSVPSGYSTDSLSTRPTVGSGLGASFGSNCVWDAASVAKWNGPYVSSSKDPWGRDYILIGNYGDLVGDSSVPDNVIVMLSYGPDGSLGGYADNVYLIIPKP